MGILHTLLLLSPSLVPADEITDQRAPVVCVVSVKGYIVESQRAGLHLSPERCACPSYFFIASFNNFLALPLEGVYNGHAETELFQETCDRRGIAPMNEPTQEFIVSELRRRVSVSMADLTQVFGPQFASLLPHEIQRMKDSGLVVYDEPLGLYSLLSLPQ